MPLRIKLAPNEELIINGAVLRNGDRRNTVTIVNPANVIRAKDVMFVDEAVTPAKKAYFLIQTLMLTAGKDEEGISDEITDILSDLGASVDFRECLPNIMEVANEFSGYDYYKALLAMKNVISFEQKVLEEKLKGNLNVNNDEPAGGVEFVH